jgi:hypothetical protein
MVNYKNSKIYKIVGGGLVYVGSTTQRLCQRMNEHKQDKKGYEKGHKDRSVSSRFVLEYPDATILLIEKYPCEDKEQLKARERHWVDSMECVNKNRPIRKEGEQTEINHQLWINLTQEERDKKKERLRESYQQNKEKEALRKKKSYVENKEQIDAQHKAYYEANKEKIALQRKEKRLRENKNLNL